MRRIVVVLVLSLSLWVVTGSATAQQEHKTFADSIAVHTFKATVLTKPAALAPLLPLPANLYTHNFGFFCKQELNMKRSGIPVTVRVGTMDNCDLLEQKKAVQYFYH